MSRGHSLQNRTITLFSPEGRLFQVEYAFKGVTACGMTALALRGADSFAFCVQKKVPVSSMKYKLFIYIYIYYRINS